MPMVGEPSGRPRSPLVTTRPGVIEGVTLGVRVTDRLSDGEIEGEPDIDHDAERELVSLEDTVFEGVVDLVTLGVKDGDAISLRVLVFVGVSLGWPATAASQQATTIMRRTQREYSIFDI